VFENIAVSHDKEIFIIDYEELSIIENLDFDEPNGLYGICITYFSILLICFLGTLSEHVLVAVFLHLSK